MQIQVTEHKSVGQLRPFGNIVRVFVDRDYTYGYFVDEQLVFDLLSKDQQAGYLDGKTTTFNIDVASAQKIVDNGQTIYEKAKLTA